MVRRHEGLTLPQEIVDLIVGELAVLQRDRTPTLRVCSLVCSSFRFPAQRHLFSQMRLYASLWSGNQKRMHRLVNILKHKNNLISNIRSLKVVLDYPRNPASVMRSLLSSSRSLLPSSQKIMTILGLVQADQALKALKILKNAPVLEELTLATFYSRLPENPRNPIYTTLLEMCSIPKLKTLGFENIRDLPYNFIIGYNCSRAYTQLVLRDVTFAADPQLQAPTFSAGHAIETLEGLKLTRMTSSNFLTPLNTFSSHFKRLRSLEVPLPSVYEKREELWRFILGVSRSLESLELSLDVAFCAPDYRDVSPISLGLLKALRTLKFTSRVEWFLPGELNKKFRVISKLLASARSPIGVRFVGIDIFCFCGKDQSDLMHGPSVFKFSEWPLVDEALSGPMFIDLQSVEMRMITYFGASPNEVDRKDVEQGQFVLFTRRSVSVKACFIVRLI